MPERDIASFGEAAEQVARIVNNAADTLRQLGAVANNGRIEINGEPVDVRVEPANLPPGQMQIRYEPMYEAIRDEALVFPVAPRIQREQVTLNVQHRGLYDAMWEQYYGPREYGLQRTFYGAMRVHVNFKPYKNTTELDIQANHNGRAFLRFGYVLENWRDLELALHNNGRPQMGPGSFRWGDVNGPLFTFVNPLDPTELRHVKAAIFEWGPAVHRRGQTVVDVYIEGPVVGSEAVMEMQNAL